MARLLVAILLCASTWMIALSSRADAGSLADPTDCSIDNPTPTVPIGVRASYVVQMSGGNGSYSVALNYGDGTSPDNQSTSSPSASFAHFFASGGTFTQTATVISAGSSAQCTTTTVVQ